MPCYGISVAPQNPISPELNACRKASKSNSSTIFEYKSISNKYRIKYLIFFRNDLNCLAILILCNNGSKTLKSFLLRNDITDPLLRYVTFLCFEVNKVRSIYFKSKKKEYITIHFLFLNISLLFLESCKE